MNRGASGLSIRESRCVDRPELADGAPRHGRLFAIALMCSLVMGCAQQNVDSLVTLVIANVSVIDVESGAIYPNRTIVIANAHVLAIEPAANVKNDAGTIRVDGTGKYAIPGLWDMHVHLVNDEPPVDWDLDERADRPLTYAPAWVAFGVTGLREMSGGEWSLKMRDRVESGEIDGPHLIIGSPILDGPYPIFPGNGVRAIANPDQARSVVEDLHEAGYDFLKPYNFLSPESYRAILETAQRLGMEVAGELPLSVSAWDAAELGQHSIEHMTGIEIACSSREAELRQDYASGVAALAKHPELDNQVTLWNRSEWEPVASFDAERCRRLYRHLVAHDVWVTPTLVTQRRISYPEIPEVATNAYLDYITRYDADVQNIIRQFDPERRLRPIYDHRFGAIEDVQAAGVGILAGSDQQGGFWLHDELQIFVDAGMTPLEALRTATINPAKYLERSDELGTIAPGKFADIVLLNGNPLDDIGNTREIDAVILKGRLYDRRELDAMRVQLEADARAWEQED